MKQILEDNLVYKVLCGSHAYGTAMPESDVDVAGVFIQPIEYFFGLQAFDILNERAEQDAAYYSLRKYCNLAVANNPNVLELLFVDDSDVLLLHGVFRKFREKRHLFLSRRCQKTFVGYAKAQLHRIRNHRTWIEQERQAMGILWPLVLDEKIGQGWVDWRFGRNMVERIEAEFDKRIQFQRGVLVTEADLLRNNRYPWRSKPNSPEMDQYLEQLKTTGIVCPEEDDSRFWVEKSGRGLVFQKHLYDEAKKKRDQYVTWMAERNVKRHETEIQFGFDTKYAMHLVRLLRMGKEILTQGELTVRRPDAQELLSIRAGSWSYEHLVQYADELAAEIEGLTSFAVPANPSIQEIEKMVVKTTMDWLGVPTSRVKTL